MTASPPVVDERKALRAQVPLLALILATFAASFAAVQWIVVHDEPLLRSRLREWMNTGSLYNDGRFYENPPLRLFNEILPHADYSCGGVYVIGASIPETELQAWALAPDQQALIHNYSIRGSTYMQQFQFIRYLVEHDGLLRAGGPKTSILLGLYFTSAEHRATVDPGSLFHGFVESNGLYSYDLQHGIRSVPMSPAMREFRPRQYRNRAFWTWADKALFGGSFDYLWTNTRIESMRTVRTRSLNRMGDDWEAGMRIEVAQLGEMIDYLRARNVAVHALLLPEATWTQGFAPAEMHRQLVRDLLTAKSVPLSDFTRLLPDEDFNDSAHLTYTGVQRISPLMWDVARGYLRSSGLLP